MNTTSTNALDETAWSELISGFDGELNREPALLIAYATDASVYRKQPLAVAYPRNEQDLRRLLDFATRKGVSLIPRTAGTSLAGQVVGEGIVVDVSRHFNRILELNTEEGWVRVQPGVVRNELNQYLAPHGFLFGPETATASRCMIGGMVGNNSCGARSLVFKTTREHVEELKCILADGSEVVFGPLDEAGFLAKCELSGLEGDIYRHLRALLSDKDAAEDIRREYPREDIHRRNTGYALDLLLRMQPFQEDGEPFNLCKLLCGSEGTLAFTTEIKLRISPLLPKHQAVVPVHLQSVNEALRANLVALQLQPTAVELIDRFILHCTLGNREQQRNRAFVEGDPGALLVVEFCCDTEAELEDRVTALERQMREAVFGYAYPVLRGRDMQRVWSLREAGLGLLANAPGDPKPVACIEDTCVHVEDQPAYIEEFQEILGKHGLECVYYAHIGDGEIHLRPVLDLKLGKDRQRFRELTRDVAELVKRYCGSMSGEHGDGRVRAEWVRLMVGEANYERLRELKHCWDPAGILNPGKIVDAPPMNEDLRYEADQETAQFDTLFDFSETLGILRMAEKCNGTALCRKGHTMGGTMCPSYMATRDEFHTTRARANLLREMLTRSPKANKFDHEELKAVMDLCLSCKGCKSECPSNVDMARLKAEFLQHYFDANGVPLRSRIFGEYHRLLGMLSWAPRLGNALMKLSWFDGMVKRILGIARDRSIPPVAVKTLRKWLEQELTALNSSTEQAGPRLWLFVDEFCNYQDAHVGKAAVQLLTSLGYRVQVMRHPASARAMISKGLLRKARKLAQEQVELWSDLVSEDEPLVGLEPSAILGFRDEFPDLVGKGLQDKAVALAKHVYSFEGFIHRELQAGRIDAARFQSKPCKVLLHGHCQQKAIEGVSLTREVLEAVEGFQVEVIPSGCCGMAGSFGYEKEHYELSMKVGELVLFPSVRDADSETFICAPGTSCRHQLLDGTGRHAWHPAELLLKALNGYLP